MNVGLLARKPLSNLSSKATTAPQDRVSRPPGRPAYNSLIARARPVPTRRSKSLQLQIPVR
jgi:hypothetical protein